MAFFGDTFHRNAFILAWVGSGVILLAWLVERLVHGRKVRPDNAYPFLMVVTVAMSLYAVALVLKNDGDIPLCHYILEIICALLFIIGATWAYQELYSAYLSRPRYAWLLLSATALLQVLAVLGFAFLSSLQGSAIQFVGTLLVYLFGLSLWWLLNVGISKMDITTTTNATTSSSTTTNRHQRSRRGEQQQQQRRQDSHAKGISYSDTATERTFLIAPNPEDHHQHQHQVQRRAENDSDLDSNPRPFHPKNSHRTHHSHAEFHRYTMHHTTTDEMTTDIVILLVVIGIPFLVALTGPNGNIHC